MTISLVFKSSDYVAHRKQLGMLMLYWESWALYYQSIYPDWTGPLNSCPSCSAKCSDLIMSFIRNNCDFLDINIWQLQLLVLSWYYRNFFNIIMNYKSQPFRNLCADTWLDDFFRKTDDCEWQIIGSVVEMLMLGLAPYCRRVVVKSYT